VYVWYALKRCVSGGDSERGRLREREEGGGREKVKKNMKLLLLISMMLG